MDAVMKDRLRVIAPLSLAALPLIAIMVWGSWTRRAADGPRVAIPSIREITLTEPNGFHTSPPEAFRWEGVEGAASYRLTIADRDMIWPLAVREVTTSAYYSSDDERRAWSAPRSYEWTVEALPSEGSDAAIAKGTGYFSVGPFAIPKAGAIPKADAIPKPVAIPKAGDPDATAPVPPAPDAPAAGTASAPAGS